MEERLLTYGVVGLLFIALAIQIITGRALLPGVNPERDEQAGLYWVSIAAWAGLLVVGTWKAAQPMLVGS